MTLYRRGKIWWFIFEFQGRRVQESTGYTNKDRALQAEAKRRVALLDRRAGLTKTKIAPKFKEYVPEFLAWSKQQHRSKTHALHTGNCDTLLRYFSGHWLDEITPSMVEDFKLARIREERRNAHDGSIISPATVNRALTTFKLLYNHAAKCGYALENPTVGIAFLEENGDRMRVLSFDEEIRYLAAAEPAAQGHRHGDARYRNAARRSVPYRGS